LTYVDGGFERAMQEAPNLYPGPLTIRALTIGVCLTRGMHATEEAGGLIAMSTEAHERPDSFGPIPGPMA